jgi:hypothetical protein
MAKHLIGFGLFGSIVGAFVFASWLFSSNPIARVEVVEPAFSVTPWSYCDKKKKKRPTNADSPRAVADRNSGTITLYVNELPGVSSGDSTDINASFTFYAVRGDEVRIKDVVRDSLVRTVRRDAGTKWVLQYDAPWVRDLTWGDNLYVQAGVSDGSNAFSTDSAIPVLIKN